MQTNIFRFENAQTSPSIWKLHQFQENMLDVTINVSSIIKNSTFFFQLKKTISSFVSFSISNCRCVFYLQAKKEQYIPFCLNFY